MPFIKQEDFNQSVGAIGQPIETPELEVDVPVMDTFTAAFKASNPIVSGAQSLGSGKYMVGSGEVDPNYDPFEDIENTQYSNYKDRFTQVNNRAEANLIKATIDDELETQRILQQSGALGFLASISAEVVNPVNWIPVGVGVNTARKGGSILKGAATAGAAGAGIEVLNEAALHASQETRTAGESAVNIAIGTALGSVLGGGASLYIKRQQKLKDLEKSFEKDLTIPAQKDKDKDDILKDEMVKGSAIDGFDDSVGAARVIDTTLDQESLIKSFGVAKATAFLNPMLRLAHSPSKEARKISQNLVDNPVFFNKNMEGIATPQAVETLRKQYEGGLATGISNQRSQYKAYKQATSGTGQKVASYVEFQEQVAKAMRRGDTSDNPFVEKVAKTYRKEVFEPLKKVAVNLKLLPEDVSVETAESYLMRIWDKQKIVQHQNSFKDIVREWVGENAESVVQAFDNKVNKITNSIQSEIDDLKINTLRNESGLADQPDLPMGVSEEDILTTVQELKKPRPKKPQTLLSYLIREGGLQDQGGELKTIGITNKARVGAISRKGLTLDDATMKAWEEGFFPEFRERPEIDDLLSALRDDFDGTRPIVKEADFDTLAELNRLDDMQQAIDELGINVDDFLKAKKVKGTQFEQLSKLRNNVINLQKKRAADRIASLERKLADFKVEKDVEKRTFFDTDDNFESYKQDITDDITRTLLGHDGVSPMHSVKISERGPLKGRVFNIPDDRVEFFLSNDMERIAERYTRVMGTDVELQGKFGSLTLDKELRAVDENYEQLMDATNDPKELKKLKAQRDSDKNDIESMLGIMRGIGKYTADPSNKWVRVGRMARLLNYTRLMGQVLLSSFADVARPVMVHGMGRVLGKGLRGVITQSKGYKMSVEAAKKGGAVTERYLQGRIATLAELGDPYANGTAFERFAQNLSNSFSKLTMMDLWNDLWKGVSATITQDRLITNIQAVAKGKKLSQKETRYMAFLGMDKPTMQQMAKMLKKYGQKESGINIANFDKWGDEGYELSRIFKAAMNKDVDRTIVTKGIADVPLFVNSEIGKTFMQFKSFALASNQRVLIAGLQQGDTAFIQGLIFAVTAGMAVYAMKEKARGKELSDNPAQWIIEGVDQSGVAAVMMEANNMYEKVGGTGLAKMAGAAPVSRYASRNLSGTLAGPTSGLINDAGVATRAILTQDLTKSDVRAMRRLLPFQNLFYIRQILNKAEDAIAQELGAK